MKKATSDPLGTALRNIKVCPVCHTSNLHLLRPSQVKVRILSKYGDKGAHLHPASYECAMCSTARGITLCQSE